MNVTTRITWDISTWEVLEHQYFEYSGTWELVKGSDRAKQTQDQEMAMQHDAFNRQKAIEDQVKGALSKYLTGNVGFDPATMSSMTSQFLNENDQGFNSAGQQVRAALSARGSGGGALPVGGDYVKGISSLMGAKAGSQSQGMLGLRVQNALQALTNKFNTANIFSGNAATLTGTQGVAGSAASNALSDYIKASNSGFGASFMSSFGGALGKGLGAGITGGVGNAVSKVPGFGGSK